LALAISNGLFGRLYVPPKQAILWIHPICARGLTCKKGVVQFLERGNIGKKKGAKNESGGDAKRLEQDE
jgi:hypothetical protein